MKGHDTFGKLHQESKAVVWRVAQWLVERGFPVKINPSRVGDYNNWKQYVDSGDLEISLRIEVKGSGYDFTCADDYPFKNVIICAKHSFDNAYPKPYLYLILNRQKTYVARIYARQYEDWFAEERLDPTKTVNGQKGYRQVFYFIDKYKVDFMPFEDTQVFREPKIGPEDQMRLFV